MRARPGAWRPIETMPFANYPNLGATGWMLSLLIGGVGAETIGRCFFPLAYVAWLGYLCQSVSRASPGLAAAAVGVAALERPAQAGGAHLVGRYRPG